MKDLIVAAQTMRDACAAACRVIASSEQGDQFMDQFEAELRAAGIQDGFGKEADATIKKYMEIERRGR